MRLHAQLAQQSVFDLFPGYVLHMQDAAFGMTALFAKIKLAMSRNVTFIELHTEPCELADTFRPFGHNRAYDCFVTQTGSRFKRVTHVQFKRVLVAGHASDSSLRPSGVCVRALPFRYNSYRPVLRRFQCKTQASDTAADHHEVVFLHPKRILSIKRVFPKNTASASNEFGPTVSMGCKVSASTSPT